MTQQPGGRDAGFSPRDLLDVRKVVVDTVVPTAGFVVANATLGLGWAATLAVGWCVLVFAVRSARRQRLVFAASGLAGVVVAALVALRSGEATGFFLPGIVGNLALGAGCVLSNLVRRPLVAVTSAALYRYEPEWYWHPRVRPAYSEITWLWAVYYLGKGALQAALAARDAVGLLTAVRLGLGWPGFAVLLLATYAYVTWRLKRLAGPTIEEWRAEQATASVDQRPRHEPDRQAPHQRAEADEDHDVQGVDGGPLPEHRGADQLD